MPLKNSFGVLAYFSSVIALLSAIMSYMNTVSLGFPDGHLSAFERALKPLLIGYSVLALLFGILFYALARMPSKKFSTLVFYFALALYGLLLIGLVALYWYFKVNLPHGQGG